MMIPNKYGTMIRVSREHIYPISFKNKETEMMQNFVDAGIEKYVFFSTEQINLLNQDE
jgi:hypothetical protein